MIDVSLVGGILAKDTSGGSSESGGCRHTHAHDAGSYESVLMDAGDGLGFASGVIRTTLLPGVRFGKFGCGYD
jgi:hypothetical protein